jgi:very-short-patch-repair endonuclease
MPVPCDSEDGSTVGVGFAPSPFPLPRRAGEGRPGTCPFRAIRKTALLESTVMEEEKYSRLRTRAELRQRATELQRKSTIAEARLWQGLRRDGLGVKVRRQHPIGPFIADFCVLQRRLIIEIDGGVHHSQTERDNERTVFLEAAGYKILRFTNEQVMHDIEDVLAQLRTAIANKE